jgi:hypothetical protein
MCCTRKREIGSVSFAINGKYDVALGAANTNEPFGCGDFAKIIKQLHELFKMKIDGNIIKLTKTMSPS